MKIRDMQKLQFGRSLISIKFLIEVKMPKQCECYEEALHFDCAICDEVCKFRKPQPNRNDFLLFTIYLVIVITILYLIL